MSTKLLFDNFYEDFKKEEVWEKEWQGMPEFNQKDLTPYQSVIIHFRNKEDRIAFSKLIGQNLTFKTQSVWYPKAENVPLMDKRYINES